MTDTKQLSEDIARVMTELSIRKIDDAQITMPEDVFDQLVADIIKRQGDLVRERDERIKVLEDVLCQNVSKSDLQSMADQRDQFVSIANGLADRVKVLEDALRFYANEDVYWHVTDGGKCYEMTNADQGAKAREALNQGANHDR
jgi:uncharacterized protein YllA (UPF0747 family)